MSYINHLRQTNSGQDIVHSQFLKTARILASFIVIVIFCGAAWLFDLTFSSNSRCNLYRFHSIGR